MVQKPLFTLHPPESKGNSLLSLREEGGHEENIPHQLPLPSPSLESGWNQKSLQVRSLCEQEAKPLGRSKQIFAHSAPRSPSVARAGPWSLLGCPVAGESAYGKDGKCLGPVGLCLYLMACSCQVSRSREVEPAYGVWGAELRYKGVFYCIKASSCNLDAFEQRQIIHCL